MNNKTKFSWDLFTFVKGGDGEVVKQVDLGKIQLCKMQSIFKLTDDEMCDVYIITENEKPHIERLAGQTLDLDLYEYQLNRYGD